MTDVFSKTKRSEVMSRILSRGNKETEIAFMSLLRKHRIKGWRRHRQLMLTRLSDNPILVIGTHFAGRTAGHVVRVGDAYRLAE